MGWQDALAVPFLQGVDRLANQFSEFLWAICMLHAYILFILASHFQHRCVFLASLYVNSPLPFAPPEMYAILASSTVRDDTMTASPNSAKNAWRLEGAWVCMSVMVAHMYFFLSVIYS